MKDLVRKLHKERRLEACEYRSLLLCEDRETIESLHEAARETAVERFGKNIYIRGLIEITNICRNDCLYCGIPLRVRTRVPDIRPPGRRVSGKRR